MAEVKISERFKPFHLIVDTKKELTSEKIKVSQNDLNSAKLIIGITQDGNPLPLTNAGVKAAFKKPDGKLVFQDQKVEIEDAETGSISIVLTTQTVAVVGDVLGEIHIEEEGKRIVTSKFRFYVEESFMSDSTIESTNELGIIEKAIEAGEKLEGVDVPALVASKEIAEEAKAKSEENSTQIGILSQKVAFKSNTIVLFGDSITEQNSIITSTYAYNYSKGFFSWANVLLGSPFNVLNNAGIGGNRTDQMIARIDKDVLQYKPQYCFFMGGVNDISANITYEDLIANLENIYKILTQNNIVIITSTITPSHYHTTAAQKLIKDKTNAWIRNYAINNPNVILVDMAKTLINAADASLVPGLSSDGTHPVQTGAILMGTEVYNVLKNFIKPIPMLGISNTDATILNQNPMMLGDNAGVATGWTFPTNAGLTYSKEVRKAPEVGEWQKIVSTANGNFVANGNSVTTGFAVGDSV
ncbi:GDSL-type esterase/lipase family protein, partial [Bacillus sp. XF8]|uniref:GDSL-type esterase/lipase family protein n=1 Tax=Bacillus sp. XF8 TaxID=2819289 RepID=UPI001AA025DD